MHERGTLYTSAPFVMFDEGGVVWCGVRRREKGEGRREKGEGRTCCCRHVVAAVVVVVAIAMSCRVMFLSFCRLVVVFAVMSSSPIAVTVAVVMSRSSCWCRVLVFLSSCSGPCPCVVVEKKRRKKARERKKAMTRRSLKNRLKSVLASYDEHVAMGQQ